ncbi:PREDICTED: kinesin-like protein KIF24 [Chinchilla lanigera]|uniref:Kinesin-like protein KIF24 n=1 Tax=Chinchilla lanigera TaxID=34839 RepID=A0A8C2US77_CHILA|nr:PREDICTED: kinesin-like protein KIF24 [Chinchilla lanigera]XP_005401144.1 PREDICTED: kinesin-like protein KIF24 [Chinchilla lanigera]XP_005401145.1 PREDICTED: kinesin-like protein KIF24 [Chinchilla lanigera]XP_005401146.1 PREDICTED: kinesin-like protein KIF24 [Chinchilla lanigera]XP_013378436.1 PREDICTED: kinesin-like protein KIF24 [Chinchilla lanigera]XP_013378438.1 PREDICTED: kinesin-like protein KIF24 [Chinchilla lanigera]XP_013378439.1 PREDICTED: kinesin-like protein KIF24 [Chinchilla 
MASWLYECLCEAELAQYYPHFTALGLQKIDELAKVTMKDYSKLGVRDMNDRKRLFQLIRIIKIMQEEEKTVSPDHPFQTSSQYIKTQEFRSGPRRQLQFDSPVDNKDRTASRNGFEMHNMTDFSANEQKSTKLKVLEHMLPEDSQYRTKARAPSATAAESCVQTETKASLFSSHLFSPILGNCDIPIIQRVSHGSGYNYGVPQPCIRQNTSDKENPWTEMEKIRVCVRKRPLGLREVRRGEINIITVEDEETLLVHEKKEAVDLTQYVLQHVFYFDEVFGEACTNRDVYLKTTHPLIQHIFNGGNATCFAYGQTGAGKTYTMIGTHQNPGLYALAAKDIFRQLEVSQPRRHLFVWISFYEIYCGQLYDLLNRRKRLFAREDSKHVVQIVGLQELRVDTVELLLEVILKGSKERSTGATGVNADSSRSHAIIQIQIKDPARRTFGRISFIDLAGSERAADARDSDRQTKMEGAEINQSLLALKECIRALDQEHTHTPFRQSKLTQVLKDSFIGNAKTCMIANISPSHVATEHTLNTLRYADRVKELKKGIKCCTSASSRNRVSGNTSPKRVQSCPVALPGDKCSPKKVKLGFQRAFAGTPGSTRGKAHPLASHPPNVPCASTPQVPGRKGSSGRSPPQEWAVQTSPVKDTVHSGLLTKRGAEEWAPLCSERSHVANRTALAWARRALGPAEGPARGKLPSKGRKVQTVQPVQKQPVSRAELSSGSSHRSAAGSRGSEAGAPARPAADAWTGIPPQQREREEHLRFYHQQFQQPPLLQQKLKYQPLERFLCQYRAPASQLQDDAPPSQACSDSPDGAQAEDLDDSDFSEDSFSHASSQRAAKQRSALEKGESSFFLHQDGEQSPAGPAAGRRHGLLFHSRTGGDEKALTESWVCSGDAPGRRRPAFSHRHSPGKLRLDWSREENGAASEPPSCARPDLVYAQKRSGPAADLRQDASGSEVPGEPEGSLPSLEDGSSLSHIVVPGSADQGDTGTAQLREVGEKSPSQVTRTAAENNPVQGEGSSGQSSTCSECASGHMAPLTVSLLATPDGDSRSLEQPTRDGAVRSPGVEGTGAPAAGHTASPGRHEAASRAGPLWLSSSPPDDRPGGALPALSPSPIRCHPPDKLPGREAEQRRACPSREPVLLSPELVGAEQCDADADEPGLDGCWGAPGEPSSAPRTGPCHSGSAVALPAGSCDAADEPWGQDRTYPGGLCWRELGLPTDPMRLSCDGEDVMWLKRRPRSRCLVSPDSALVPGYSPRTAGTLCQPALQQAQQAVIHAHREQLDEMAELGFKEETLVSQLVSNEFEEFVTQLDEIMALKSKCIQSLRSQLQLYLTYQRP